MKQHYIKTIFLCLCFLAGTTTAIAETVVIDGIYYNLFPKTQLAEVTKKPNGSYYLGNIIIPETITHDGVNYSVSSIGDEAFENGRLASITIPNSVISIGDWAFRRCSLTSIIIPSSVTSIGSAAFSNCSGLTSITIPGSVTSIGDNMFQYCSNLTSATILEGVTRIGSYAFKNCSSLTSVIIPNSVTSIGAVAFSNCNSLASVSIPNSVTSIGSSAFADCSSLSSVTMGSSITHIYSSAFSKCPNLYHVYCFAEQVPNSEDAVLNIFEESDIEYATLHVPAASMESYKTTEPWSNFGTIVAIKSEDILFADVNIKTICLQNWDANGDGELSKAEAAAVTDLGTAFKDNPKIVSFNELPYFTSVTSIGDSTFYGCTGLTSVTIPNSVTSIGKAAFYNCSSLTSVTIPEIVTSIGSNAFDKCSGLTSVHITDLTAWCNISFGKGSSNPLSNAHHLYLNGEEIKDLVIPEGMTSIGDHAFSGSSGLTSVTIPNSVTSIGDYAFSGCDGLTSVDIPNSVTSIGEGVFCGSDGLTSVDIPNSVTSIGESAFMYCSGLTSVTIGNGVTSIGESAFKYCSGLTSVTIGNGVTSIGYHAFSYCSRLKEIKCLAKKPPVVNASTFWYNVNVSNVTLYVPKESYQQYKEHTIWGKFDIAIMTGIELTQGSAEGKKDVYDTNGRRLQSAQRGINIIRYSDGSTKKVLMK